MEFVLFLNVHSHVMYEVMFGDKDTFELAFMLAGKAGSFQKMPSWAQNALSEKTEVSCSISLLPSAGSCRRSGLPFTDCAPQKVSPWVSMRGNLNCS